MVVALTGSPALAGIGTSILGASRFMVGYPFGKLTDAIGRRPGLALAVGVGLLGSLLTGLAMMRHSFPLFLGGLMVFGLGMGAAQQIRLAAAEMFPVRRRAEGIGIVLTGSLVGALLAPLVVRVAQGTAPGMGVDVLALPWLLVPLALCPALLSLLFVRPDPKAIASHLERYWPEEKPPAPAPHSGAGGGFLDYLRRYPTLVAFVCSLSAQGNMAMVMALTSLALNHHGHSPSAISLSVSIHVVGMFGFSLPLGRLADRIGRRAVLALGMVIAGVGSALVPLSPHYWVITTGTFLVGLGWSFVNVGATALIADVVHPGERGRAIGANDTFSNAMGIVLPVAMGVAIASLGLGVLGLVGVVMMVPALLLTLRLRDSHSETLPAPAGGSDHKG
ncbi:Riboflavin transporter RfnT [bacterium HR23]|nr:Riboflavin transporter RfnT [bacterium HR23]